MTIRDSENFEYVRKNRDSFIGKLKCKEEFNSCTHGFFKEIVEYKRELAKKYNLLDIVLKIKSYKDISSRIDLVNNELKLDLIYKEKYKSEKVQNVLEFRIRCSG